MKICYIAVDVAVPHFRGSSTHVYELARNLVKMGHDVYVISRRVSYGQPPFEVRDGVKIFRLYRGIVFSSPKSSFTDMKSRGSYRGSTPRPIWKLYEMYLMTLLPLYAGIKAANLIIRNHIDVILERESSFGAGVIASRITNRPLILEVIGNRVMKSQLERAQKIITYTASMFTNIVEAQKIETVTAAVDTNLFRPDLLGSSDIRKKYGLGNATIVGYVGTFQEWHGMDELIESSKILIAEYPNIKFLMVGPYFATFQEKVERTGLRDHFVFTGPIEYEKVPKYIAASDILVAPYNPNKIESSEQVRKHGLGSPLKVFEYMAVSKPVITTSVEPISDIVADHLTGLLVPPGDPVALANAMIELVKNEKLARSLGEEGRKLVLEKYSWDQVAGRISSILEQEFLSDNRI